MHYVRAEGGHHFLAFLSFSPVLYAASFLDL